MIEHDYRCTKCGADTERDLLTVKKVIFLEMGERPSTIKSRTEGWLCPRCVAKDEAFNIPKGYAPGNPEYRSKGATHSKDKT